MKKEIIERRLERRATREEALSILAQMNDMIRGKDFMRESSSAAFMELNAKIQSLGWLALVRKTTFKVVKTENGRSLRALLKLVSPDSKEAQALP